MLHRLRQAIADDFVAHGAHGPEDVAAAQVAFWKLLRSPYFKGNHEHLAFLCHGPFAFSLEMKESGNTIRIDPLQDFYPDDWDDLNTTAFRVPFPTITQDPVAVISENGVSPSVLEKAQAQISRVASANPRFKKLVSPSAEDQRRRNLIDVEVLTRDEHDVRLDALLGEGVPSSLRAEGIRYHAPSWSDSSDWRYLLAHNGEEVAGVLGFYASEKSLVLSYVSVAPGFRKQGLSLRLYKQLLSLCQSEQRFLVRSSPGEFTKENPGITQAYSRLLRESPVLHVTTGGYLQKAIQDGLDEVGMDRLFPLAKPVCDARTKEELKGYEADQWEREAVLKLRSDWSALSCPSKPKAPRP